MNDKLSVFIKAKRELGLSDDEIRTKLLGSGWKSEDVEQALRGEAEDDVPKPNYSEETPKKAKMANVDQWVAFEHILMFISLFIFVVATTLLLGIFINKWFPIETISSQAVNYNYGATANYEKPIIRVYLAIIIVSYPIFAFLFLKTTRRIKHNLEEQFLPSRRKLIYITLIATFLEFFVGVVIAIYRLISGDLYLNSVLHLLMRMMISGIIFGYYLIEVRKSHEKF